MGYFTYYNLVTICKKESSKKVCKDVHINFSTNIKKLAKLERRSR